MARCVFAAVLVAVMVPASVFAESLKLVRIPRDPYGAPRPGPNEQHVPLRTSFYVEISAAEPEQPDAALADSLSLRLQAEGGEPIEILRPGRVTAPSYRAEFFTYQQFNRPAALAVCIDSQAELAPVTVYRMELAARSAGGATLPEKDRMWTFTTEAAPSVHPLSFDLDVSKRPVTWHGAFFSGFCKPSFCTSRPNLIATYELMDEIRRQYPRAWSLQRDFWMTGMQRQPELLSGGLPNVVRERETRRIVRMEPREAATLLHVEDFFGHAQYGIPSGRPLSTDYRPGVEVLIADGVHDARARVLAVADAAGMVLLSRIEAPEGGWKLEYDSPPPREEKPEAPGLFPPGGCFLVRFHPPGTPHYYWDRLDAEWDLAHRRFGRRLMPNFADAPGDLAIDGGNFTTAKDLAELHEVVRRMTSHVIERYGDACLTFPWSVFNEPDLGVLFWRSDWAELQRFYDYTVDAILRAFEDHGYYSSKVFVGGLELGGIFGTNLKVREFLAHCSPRGEAQGALPLNAAFADRRLDGRRSKRVENLCRASAGRGSPCDFISIHAYNRSETMAAKLVRAKEIALEIDPEYYAGLWVSSHESCPNWAPPPDVAAEDSYRGNGYFPTWCADVARRQLQRAVSDPRYAFGETILTFWPWPNRNLSGAVAGTREILVDDDGDGDSDRTVTVAMPILHFLGLMNSMSGEYHVLPERTVGGHVVSGFAAQGERDLRVLLYAHHALDTQSRSETSFRVDLNLAGVDWPRVRVTECRYDKDHNSYFRAIQRLLAEDASASGSARPALPTNMERHIVLAQKCFAPEAVEEIRRLSQLQAADLSVHAVQLDGTLRLSVELSANGADFLVLSPHE